MRAAATTEAIAHAIASLLWFNFLGGAVGKTESMLTTIHRKCNVSCELLWWMVTEKGAQTALVKLNTKVIVKEMVMVLHVALAPAGSWAAISITTWWPTKPTDKVQVRPLFARSPHLSQLTWRLYSLCWWYRYYSYHYEKRETINEVHTALAASVRSWNNLLMAAGCTLHPDKSASIIICCLIITTRWSSAGYMKFTRTIATATF